MTGSTCKYAFLILALTSLASCRQVSGSSADGNDLQDSDTGLSANSTVSEISAKRDVWGQMPKRGATKTMNSMVHIFHNEDRCGYNLITTSQVTRLSNARIELSHRRQSEPAADNAKACPATLPGLLPSASNLWPIKVFKTLRRRSLRQALNLEKYSRLSWVESVGISSSSEKNYSLGAYQNVRVQEIVIDVVGRNGESEKIVQRFSLDSWFLDRVSREVYRNGELLAYDRLTEVSPSL